MIQSNVQQQSNTSYTI